MYGSRKMYFTHKTGHGSRMLYEQYNYKKHTLWRLNGVNSQKIGTMDKNTL